jgi:hypothetical protein
MELNTVAMRASQGYDIERKREGEAEAVFVPFFSGPQAWHCRGLEDKGISGKFIGT